MGAAEQLGLVAAGRDGQRLRISVCATQGGRKYMEDRVDVSVVRGPDGEVAYVYAAVYDGHGGAEASDFARRHLRAAITEQPGFASGDDNEVLQAIREGFLACHEAMRRVVATWARTASGFPSTAGTTSSVAFVMRGKVFTGHVGDSAVIIARRSLNGDIEGDSLTVDHKPESPAELQRIREAGGQVQPKSGVMRVVWRRPLRGHTGPVRRSTQQESIPFLAVARALGDLWSYNEDSDTFVVSPDPDTRVVPLDGRTTSLILGSDGLWNVMRAQQAAEAVEAAEKRTAGLANHARGLVKAALRGWGSLRADNITALVLMFDGPSAKAPPSDALISSCSEPDFDVDAALLRHPTALIRICRAAPAQVLKTDPLDLVYAGTMDPPLQILMSKPDARFAFSGPGFTDYIYESRSPAERRVIASSPNLLKSASFRVSGGGVDSPLARSASDAGRRKTIAVTDENRRTEAKTVDLSQSFARGTFPSIRAAAVTSSPAPGVRITRRPLDPPAAAPPPKEEDPPTSKAVPPASKAKYVCRKHGYACEKVKKMNREYDERKRKACGGSPKDLGSEEEETAPALKRSRTEAKPRPTPAKTTPPKADPPVAARVTRSGTPLSPAAKARVATLSLTPASVGRYPSRAKEASRTVASEPPAAKKTRSPVCPKASARIRKDLQASKHLFRVRNLRNRLKGKLAPIPKQSRRGPKRTSVDDGAIRSSRRRTEVPARPSSALGARVPSGLEEEAPEEAPELVRRPLHTAKRPFASEEKADGPPGKRSRLAAFFTSIFASPPRPASAEPP